MWPRHLTGPEATTAAVVAHYVASGETGHRVSSLAEKENRRFNIIIYIGNTWYYYCVVHCNNIMLPGEVHTNTDGARREFRNDFIRFFCEKFDRRCRRRQMERDNTSSQYSHWIFYNNFFQHFRVAAVLSRDDGDVQFIKSVGFLLFIFLCRNSITRTAHVGRYNIILCFLAL